MYPDCLDNQHVWKDSTYIVIDIFFYRLDGVTSVRVTHSDIDCSNLASL